MNDWGDHRLPVAVDRLLREERLAPPPPPEVAARVLRRLGRSLGLTVATASWLTGKTYLVLALVAGASIGVVSQARKPPAGEVAAMNTAPVAAASRPPAAHSPGTADEAPPGASAPARRGRAEPGGDLARENALLLQARRALAGGNAAAALVPLQRHARRWPQGTLAQEREVLVMEALARSGDHAAARRRAEAFLRRFAGSTLASTARRWAGRGD